MCNCLLLLLDPGREKMGMDGGVGKGDLVSETLLESVRLALESQTDVARYSYHKDNLCSGTRDLPGLKRSIWASRPIVLFVK